MDKIERLRILAGEEYWRLLEALDNTHVLDFLAAAAEWCEPDSLYVADDSEEARAVTRARALEAGEERPLACRGHRVHFDGPADQGRDREVTRYLVPAGERMPDSLHPMDREQGLAEIRGLLRGSMKGRIMIVRFLTLGPNRSEFSIPCLECTDSWYVSHSLDLLYRPGYEEFKRRGAQGTFFATLHSNGRLDERMTSADPDKKRIYIDYAHDRVYSVNTQYAGNTVGLKKLALRLTIRKADREGWLAEHMFLMGVQGPGGRRSYFAGAFPSACGKTSTAMLPGETILGDDIAYFREVEGQCRAVNAEAGIFGIIQNVTATDDPVIWEVLTEPGEVVFSNILVHAGKPYWLGMRVPLPPEGENFQGAWRAGLKDAGGREVPPAHKNARYAVSLARLANCDAALDQPAGVPLRGILYGGRDARAYVPVQESFDWAHGIVAYGAALETETTFATIGREGVPEINMMSIQDFVSIPFGRYLRNNLTFGARLAQPPRIFGVNYFLADEAGCFLNGVRDKHVWLKWMELRVHGEAPARKAPTGWLPCYEDLERLFQEVLKKPYRREDYRAQFTLRVPENLAKIERVEKFYRRESEVPAEVFERLFEQRDRLEQARRDLGGYIDPECFEAS